MKNDEIKNSNNNSNQAKNGEKSEKTTKAKKRDFWSVISTMALLLTAGALLYLYSENYHKKNYDTLNGINSDLSNELAYRDSLINEWVEAFNEIEKDLITMREKENLLKINSSDVEFTKDIKERILSEIRQLNSLLKENKEKIALLNNKLKKSGIELKALNEKVINLENELLVRDLSISELKVELTQNDFMIEDLNMLIDSLDYEIITKNEEILLQQAKLNRAYLALGSSKELKKRGLLEKKGGFLGLLGKSKTVPTALSEDEFKVINIKQTNKIIINSKKAEFISDHPKDSYEIVSNDSLISYIEIIDPNEFWKITRYAVVETGK